MSSTAFGVDPRTSEPGGVAMDDGEGLAGAGETVEGEGARSTSGDRRIWLSTVEVGEEGEEGGDGSGTWLEEREDQR
ncbi:hypothetical protein U1Q18_023204 [Sarracenia purpurea var. burkii]